MRVVSGETFPDAQDLGEQTQGHAPVLGTLMFEEQERNASLCLRRMWKRMSLSELVNLGR